MAQPNKREEQDIDPREGKNQGNPLDNANPVSRHTKEQEIVSGGTEQNLSRKAGSEHKEEQEEPDTSGVA